MLPDEKVMCHRTGFATSCFDGVTKHKCRLWKRVTLTDRDPESGAEIGKDAYDCIDSLQDLFWKDMLRRQLQTTATVDKLSKEVRESNAGAMGALLGGVNHTLQQMAAHTPDYLIGGNGAEPRLLEDKS